MHFVGVQLPTVSHLWTATSLWALVFASRKIKTAFKIYFITIKQYCVLFQHSIHRIQVGFFYRVLYVSVNEIGIKTMTLMWPVKQGNVFRISLGSLGFSPTELFGSVSWTPFENHGLRAKGPPWMHHWSDIIGRYKCIRWRSAALIFSHCGVTAGSRIVHQPSWQWWLT